ncbi:MAG: M67 family metallopeptidase [Limnothrix sp.]
MLKISQGQLNLCHNHARSCYPEECCGLLLGKDKTVVQVWQVVNSWTPDFGDRLPASSTENNSRLNRFAIDPKDILTAQKFARTSGLDIIGIYHSHPDHPAIPSASDLAIAWDIYSYIIMSVTAQSVTATRSWVLTEDQFQEEDLTIFRM